MLTSRNVWKCAFHLTKTWNIAKSRNKEWRQPNIGKTSNDARIITLKSNPSRGTALPAPHGKGNKCEFTRTKTKTKTERSADWRQADLNYISFICLYITNIFIIECKIYSNAAYSLWPQLFLDTITSTEDGTSTTRNTASIAQTNAKSKEEPTNGICSCQSHLHSWLSPSEQ